MRWIFMVLGLAAPVSAEPLPGLFDVLAEIEGREVQVEGRLVQRIPGQGLLLTENGGFVSVYALTRDKLASVGDCKTGDLFSASNGCKVSVSAEIRIDGSDVSLVIFDLSMIE